MKPAPRIVTDWRSERAVVLGSFIVQGPPLAWARTNVVNGRPVTDEKQRAYKARVALLARVNGFRVPSVRPILIRLKFFLIHKPDAMKLGDWDNLSKIVCDALNGVAWVDDGQIVKALPEKYQDKARTRTEVSIAEFL